MPGRRGRDKPDRSEPGEEGATTRKGEGSGRGREERREEGGGRREGNLPEPNWVGVYSICQVTGSAGVGSFPSLSYLVSDCVNCTTAAPMVNGIMG